MYVPSRALLMMPFLLLPAGLARAQDTVRLRNGEVLEGRISAENEESITLTSQRVTLTFPKELVREISRGPREGEAARDRPEELLPDLDEWFELRNPAGQLAGACHRLVATAERGGHSMVRLEEQWTFLQKAGGKLRVECLEWVQPTLEPAAFLYREWEGSEGSVLQGDVRGNQLELHAVDRHGQDRRWTVPFPPGTALPLLARARLRREKYDRQRHISLSLYDYMERQLIFGEYLVGELRSIGVARKVRVLGRMRHGLLSEEWIDGAGRTVRFEVNGPYLVAQPASEESVRAWLDKGVAAAPAEARVVEGGRDSFRIQLPNPSWSVLDAKPEEATLVLTRGRGDVNAAFLDLGELGADLTPEGVLLALERRIAGLEGYLRTQDPKPFRHGPHEGLQGKFEYRVSDGGLRTGTMAVLGGAGKRIGVVITGTKRALRDAAKEIERLIGGIEIR